MKIRPFNTDRMREHRIKHLPHYQVQYINRDDIADIVGVDVLAWIMAEMKESFGHRMRRRHIWTKRKVVIEAEYDFAIDFNQYRVIVEERFV